MDLRDRFAAHVAAALADTFADPAEVARRAYDVADAMLAERARRIDRDEEQAISGALRGHPALLDEPDRNYDEDLDPNDIEPPYDPSWDLEPRGPGLARTRPEEAEDAEQKQERSA